MAERSKTIFAPAGLFAFIILAHALIAVLGDGPARRGGLVDGDSYMRLIRVGQLIAGGGWFDQVIAEANAPDGLALHWTRPLDLVLIILAAPLAPFLGMAKALHLAGVVLSPLTHAVAGLALIWAVTPLLGRWGACLAAFLTLAQPGVMKPAGAGAADHHLLLVMLGLLLAGFVIRSLRAPTPGHGAALGAGLIAALGAWVGTEMFILLGLALVIAGLAWLAGEAGEAEDWRRGHRMSLAFALGLALAMIIERGPGGLAEIEYERLSIVHLTLAGLLLACTSILGVLQTRSARLAGAAVLAIVGMAVMVWLFPAFPQGPATGIEPAMLPVLERIEEYKPIGNAADMLGFLGTAVFALPMLAWRLRRDWAEPSRWAWLFVALCTVTFCLFAVNWLRWALYAGFFLSIPLADLILRLDRSVGAWKAGPVRVAVMVGGMTLIVLGPLLGAGILLAGRSGESKVAANNCAIAPLADNLRGMAEHTILAPANRGPEIIYRTGLSVVGTLHHGAQRGVLDAIAILRAEDGRKAREMLARRRVDLILLCPGYGGNLHEAPGDGEGLFYRRLLAGGLPQWVRELELPAELGGGYRLFRITPF